jgi:hypothetical protein
MYINNTGKQSQSNKGSNMTISQKEKMKKLEKQGWIFIDSQNGYIIMEKKNGDCVRWSEYIHIDAMGIVSY